MKSPELKKYIATAAAVLGATTFANADIVHQAVNTTLTHNGDNYSIDFDGDTNVEFTFGVVITNHPLQNRFDLIGYSANAEWIVDTFYWYPANLSTNYNIQNSLGNNAHRWLNSYRNLAGIPHYFGSFLGQTGYLGVRFQDSGGQTHYGWIQLSTPEDLDNATIIDWAYESCPDEPIRAGQSTGGATCGTDVGTPTDVPVFGPFGIAALVGLMSAAGIVARRKKEE